MRGGMIRRRSSSWRASGSPGNPCSALGMADGYEYGEEFEEEEVWAVMTAETKEASPKGRRAKDSSHTSSSSYSTRRHPTGARMIPRSNDRSETSGRALRQSAPLTIPEWSKIYENYGNDDDDDEDDERAPPHEWLAKKMARTQISTSSVCEGAGRTLKGRDLRKVRNAVLIKTGFLE